MIWVDDDYDYIHSKGKFEPLACEEGVDKNILYAIDYNKDEQKFRVTRFLHNHWDGEVVFDIFNAHCPICNEDRIISGMIGHCPKCGHHLNTNEKL